MEFLPPSQLRFRKMWISGGVILLVLVLVLSLVPYTGPIVPITFIDKIIHALSFTTLIVWFSAVISQDKWVELFGLLLSYGVLMEVLQYFTSYRFMDWEDLVADIFGLVVGWIMIRAGLANWAHWAERILVRR
jgi:VanZ family protein